LIEKSIAVSEIRLEELDNPTSSSSTTEDHDYMVVDSTSQSRLLASNAWANVKEEVLDLHSFPTFPERMCQRRDQSSSCLMQTKAKLGHLDPQFGSIIGLLAHLSSKH
jgi:hypothetical protein